MMSLELGLGDSLAAIFASGRLYNLAYLDSKPHEPTRPLMLDNRRMLRPVFALPIPIAIMSPSMFEVFGPPAP